MTALVSSPRGPLRPVAPVAGLAIAKLALLLSCATAYGYDGAELYALAKSHHLAWGYVDGPPLSVAVLAAAVRLYGETLLTVRLLPATVAAAVVVVASRVAQRLGAGVLGQSLTAACMLAAPVLLRLDHAYSAESLDVLLVTLMGLFACRALASESQTFGVDPRGEAGARRESVLAWGAVGVAAGLAAVNSFTGLVYGLALAVGLATSRGAKGGGGRPRWAAVAVALAVAAPWISWEASHAWPAMHGAVDMLRARGGPLAGGAPFLVGLAPLDLVMWGVGFGAFVAKRSLATYRGLGVGLALAAAVLLGVAPAAARGLVAACPLLFAAAAVSVEPWLRSRRGATTAWFVAQFVTCVAVTPFALPVLPVGKYLALARKVSRATSAASSDPPTALPAHFASMFGWPELVRATGGVYATLAPDERAEAVILASGRERAAALEVLGPALGLPFVISGSGAFAAWGAAGASGKLVIAVGGDESTLRAHFDTVDVVTVFAHSLAPSTERRVRIYVCRGAKRPLELSLGDFKAYD